MSGEAWLRARSAFRRIDPVPFAFAMVSALARRFIDVVGPYCCNPEVGTLGVGEPQSQSQHVGPV